MDNQTNQDIEKEVSLHRVLCKKCNAPINKGQAFCSVCGRRVELPQIKSTYNLDALEKKNIMYFKFYSKLPLIIACIILGSFFIFGIIDACNEHGYYETYYGTFMFENAFLVWLLWQVIGITVSAFYYFLLKITVSASVLNIVYLNRIASNTNKE